MSALEASARARGCLVMCGVATYMYSRHATCDIHRELAPGWGHPVSLLNRNPAKSVPSSVSEAYNGRSAPRFMSAFGASPCFAERLRGHESRRGHCPRADNQTQ
eukprot:scaffold1387_cov382-Prasinococcus_capsulatus_cf.AAC.12